MNLQYQKPASKWVEALPQGNGRLGAMVFGGVGQERLALNEDTLWSGHPKDHIIPDSYEHIEAARRLILEGRAEEAEEELRAYVLGDFTESYEPLGDLMLTFDSLEREETQRYLRTLSLTNGVAETRFTCGGVDYARTTFVSYPQQAICLRMTASKPVLDVQVALTSKLRFSVAAAGHELVMTTRCPSVSLPSYYSTAADAVAYNDAPDKQGVSATTIARVSSDGDISAEDGRLVVTGASWLELRLVCRSNFDGFDRYPGRSGVDHAALARQDADAASALPFERLLDKHTQDLAPLMQRQSIQLKGESHEELPTDERLRRYAAGGEDATLPILLYQFGRYLLASGSRPGSQALNLQGIWNEAMQPPWSSNYTTNINTEMNYWPAEICNIPGVHEPLFDLVDVLSATGGKVARELFHARGAVCHHNTDIWGLATPVGAHVHGSASYAWWPMAYGWLSGHLVEHYIYTHDEQFLRKRLLPVLRNAAQFFIDTASADKDGYLTLRPATSPEHKYILNGKSLSAASATTMTDEIIREMLQNYLAALSELGADEPDARAARNLLEHLPPLRIGADGRLLEWDAEYEETEPQHRHLSPLCGVFPGHLITADSDARVLRAVYAMLDRRGDGGTGWSLGWKVNMWARLRDGDHALSLLRKQLAPVETDETSVHGGGSYLNLFCAHPPFQIDGNFAAASGVPRLLIDSAADEITILPALPSSWRELTAYGLRGANGYEAALRVENGRLVELRLTSGSAMPTKIRVGSKSVVLTLQPGETVENPPELMGV